MLEKDHCARVDSCTVVFIVYASCLKIENGSSLTFSSWCKFTHLFRLPVRAVSHVVVWRVIVSLRVILNKHYFRQKVFDSSSDLAQFFGHKPIFMKRGMLYRNKCSLLAFPTCYIAAVRCRYCWGDQISISKLYENVFLKIVETIFTTLLQLIPWRLKTPIL